MLRGTVSAYPSGPDAGLVEVKVGACDPQYDTVLARVEQSMSGVYWLPELGDVVEVELSDLPGYEARVVHIHRKAQDAQTSACWTEHNDRKQLRTRSGHTLTLDDTQDRTQIVLRTAGGLELVMEDQNQTLTLRASQADTPFLTLDMGQNTITLSADKALTLSCGASSLVFDRDGNLSIQAKGTLSLSGKDLSLEAQDKLSGGGQQVELSGSMSASVSGENQVKLSSGGVAQVKGSAIELN